MNEHKREGQCEISGCNGEAIVDGWIQRLDPFTGEPIGKLRMQVCRDCIVHTVAFKAKGEKVYEELGLTR